MARLDRVTRAELAASGELFDTGYEPRMARRVNERNAQRLRRVIESVGWPGTDLLGPDGAEAAWTIVQHAIAEPDLLRRALPLLETAARVGRADPAHAAMLEDRIRFFEGRPQRYGTQLDWDAEGNLSPGEVEDPQRLAERRPPTSASALGGDADDPPRRARATARNRGGRDSPRVPAVHRRVPRVVPGGRGRAEEALLRAPSTAGSSRRSRRRRRGDSCSMAATVRERAPEDDVLRHSHTQQTPLQQRSHVTPSVRDHTVGAAPAGPSGRAQRTFPKTVAEALAVTAGCSALKAAGHEPLLGDRLDRDDPHEPRPAPLALRDAAAVEQRHVEVLLQRPDAVGDGGRGDAGLLRRRGRSPGGRPRPRRRRAGYRAGGQEQHAGKPLDRAPWR